jgi:hypothetical protein
MKQEQGEAIVGVEDVRTEHQSGPACTCRMPALPVLAGK